MTEPIWNVWELTHSIRQRAAASGLPVIDLGQGTPIDPTPAVAQDALTAAADAPGYPPAHGTVALREAYSDWVNRRWGATLDPVDVVATVGSKEFIATLPWLSGLGPADLVVIPELAYPTYRAGAQQAGCRVIAADSLTSLGPQMPALLWLNTPGNPTGRILPAEHLAKVVDWARERETLVVSDECYIELTEPGETAPSILSPEVSGGSHDGILAVHSLSKRSSMAGYRCGFAAGDPKVVANLVKRRRDMGLIVPTPVQAAATATLAEDGHVAVARQQYAERRTILRAALEWAGLSVTDSQAGLFVWATQGRTDSETVAWLADRGIVAAPGSFYGPSGADHVRLSLTATVEDMTEVARRLRA